MATQKNKHMTLEDRLGIEDCLRHGMTFKQIAANIGKDQATVFKEIRKTLHRDESEESGKTNVQNSVPGPLCMQRMRSKKVLQT